MANVKYVVTLTGDEREGLLAVVDRGRAPATQTRHANILLAVDRGEHAGPGMTDAQAAARARIPPLRDSGPVAGRVGRTSDGVRLSAARYTGGGVERTPGDDAHSGRSREHRPNLRPEAGDAGSAGGVGAGGSDAPSLLASSLDRPAGRRDDPLAGETREDSDHAGLHGNTRAAGGGGRSDADRARRRVGAHPREGEAPPGHRPGPPRVRVRAQARLLAEPGRGPLLEDGPPDAALRSGSRAKTSPKRGFCATSGKASAEPIVHGRGRDLSDTGPTTEGPVVDTLLSDGADRAS